MTLIAAAGLAACAPDEPERPPGHTPNHHPVFASDEEALAAAEDAYSAYLAVANLVAQEGGMDPERYADVVTHSWLSHEIESAAAFSESGTRQVGEVAYSSLSLQQVDLVDGSLSVYACLDVSGARILDAGDIDVTPEERDPVVPVELDLRALKTGLAKSPGGPPVLLIDGSELWTGQDFC